MGGRVNPAKENDNHFDRSRGLEMQLIGMLDSPFVRRVAVSMRMLGIEYEHNPLSIFRTYDEFRSVNPLVKVPTLVCDDGEMLIDSSLIISHLEELGR